ncbi:MAG: thioredoxin family protein [Porphyromonadaceae bacterium]|nr:thioredoxin family protein [Porphyromonadaceae bacterium]
MFYTLTVIISEVRVKQMSLASEKTNLIELDEIKFEDNEVRFVFFHDNNSQLCRKMRFNIEQFIENEENGILFYAIDVQKNPEVFYEHNVSGIPNILVFKGDKEIQRIMGIVSYKNLKKIVQSLNEDA